jgi:hypothetical protein
VDTDPQAAIIVRNADGLKAWLESPWRVSPQPLVIQLPQLPAGEAKVIAARLDQARSECGCSLGAKCMISGTAVALAWLTFRLGFLTPAFLWRLPLALLFALLCAGAGKAVGLLLARRRLRRDIRFLLTIIQNSL